PTALHLAAAAGHSAVVKLLLARGANVDLRQGSTPGSDTPLHSAARGPAVHRERMLKRFGESGFDAAEANRIVHLVIGNGHVEVGKLLLDHGAALETKADKGWTPLNTAAQAGHLPFVELLLDRGADVNATDDDGFTPLLTAAETGRTE